MKANIGGLGWWGALMIWLSGAGMFPVAEAAQVVVVADRDTTLFSNGAGESNMGAFTNGIVGVTAVGARARFLVHFPVAAAVPAGARILSVQFQWSVIKQNFTAPPATFRWHRMLKPWAEGRGTGDLGSPSVAGEPSWIWRTWNAERWAAAGGQAGVDFVAQPSGSFGVTDPGRQGWMADAEENAELRADVQGWVDGTRENQGWIIVAADEGARRSARRIGTHESIEDERPELIVEYEEIPAETLTMREVALSQGKLQFQFEAASGKGYVVERSVGLAPAWEEVERIPGGERRSVLVRTAVDWTRNDFFRVRSAE